MNNTPEKKAPPISFTFIKFIKEFFINYKDFIKIHLTTKKPPFLFLIIWLLGICSAINRIESKYIYSLDYQVKNWIVFWLIVFVGGIIIGYLQYWILGALYHLKVWFSGGIKNFKTSRYLFLYTGIPIYVIVLLTAIFNNITYGNRYFIEPTNHLLDSAWAILLIIGIIYSIILSYRGVRLLLKTKYIRSIIFFIILPAIIYSGSHAWTFYQGVEYKPKWKHFLGGVHLVLEVESKGDPYIDRQNTNTIRDILTGRLRQLGIRKKIITIIGERRLIIQLPKLKNPERVIDLISKSYILEFKLVDAIGNLQAALEGNVAPDREILYRVDEDPDTKRMRKTPFLLEKRVLLTGTYLADARVDFDKYNIPFLVISFDKEGARIFERITADNVNKRLAIVLNDRVYTAPVIQEKISGGRARITGNFTVEEAGDLAIVLRGGAYPAHTTIIESKKLTRDIWMGSEN